MAAPERIHVELAYAADADHQLLMALDLPAAATVMMAIEASGIRQRFPEIDLASCAVGVFSELRGLQDGLRHGDRVEIYRPLQIDPKQARRARAAQSRKGTRERGSSSDQG